jgi:hypothetical protein
MQKREGRSFASPSTPPIHPGSGRTGRKDWQRSDMPRPTAPRPLPTPAPLAPEIEEPEEADEIDVMDILSVEARRDVLAGSVAGFGGGMP